MNNIGFHYIFDPDISITEIYSILREVQLGRWQTNQHIHRDMIFFILEGEYRAYVNGKRLKVRENDILYIPADTGYSAEGKSDKTTYIGIYFKKYNVDEGSFFSDFQHIPGCRNLKSRFSEIEKLFSRASLGRSLKLKTELYSLLDSIVSASLPADDSFKYYTTIKSAMDYIENNYTNNDITSVFLANLCNITPTHFARVFKRIYDTNPKDYIIKLRMARAKEYLLYSAYSVLEISTLLGYSDPAYFFAVFKRTYGVSPSAFRKNH